MEHAELSVSMSSFNGAPLLTLSGIMDAWHSPAIDEALSSFYNRGNSSITVDVSHLRFAGIEAASALVRGLRSLRPELRLHVVAHGHVANILNRADLGAFIRVCGNMDEVAEMTRPEPLYTTSRWMAHTEDAELPLAA